MFIFYWQLKKNTEKQLVNFYFDLHQMFLAYVINNKIAIISNNYSRAAIGN